MKKVIIVGASSGIGKALAELYLEKGYEVGIMARREKLLHEIASKNKDRVFVLVVDIKNINNTKEKLQDLIKQMKGVDIVIVSSGVGFSNPEVQLDKELDTIQTNVLGFTGVVNCAYQYFIKRKAGTLVAITSLAALRGAGECSSYSASKAYQSNYINGIRYNAEMRKLPIHIMDVQPGFVDTKMAQGDNLFWVASPQKAAKQIYEGIQKGRRHIYVTKRWCIIGWLIKLLPDFLYKKLLASI